MESKKYLGTTDYIVIGGMLMTSTIIGIRYRGTKNSHTTKDYMMAGKNMPLLPVAASIVVTMISGTTMIGQSSETYRYGIYNIIWCFSGVVGTFLAANIFVPVYFNCGVTTSYEYLELRYGKTTRYLISFIFIVQMVFFMSTVLYGPVLALSAFSDLSIETSIIVFGLICSFYCCVGGLKAVLWTDTFQAVLMFICLVVPLITGITEAGGIGKIMTDAYEGRRLDINFHENFTSRYTIWSALLRGVIGSLTYQGTSQVEVQRLLTLRNASRAKNSLYLSMLPSSFLFALCASMGLIFYSVFKDCDPMLNKVITGLTRYDQLLPYYIVSRLNSVPGLTGLCVAGIFSGALSSMSSALNSLATVTVLDFVVPIFPALKLCERRKIYLAKALTLVYGVVCIAFTFVIAKADSLTAVANTLVGIMEGPMLAIYLLGVLSTKPNEKCTIVGLLLGVTITSWIGYGIIFSGRRHPTLPLNTDGCLAPSNFTSYLNATVVSCNSCNSKSSSIAKISQPFILYRISFMWLPVLGFLLTVFIVCVAVCCTTGWRHDAIPTNSKCLSPISRIWKKKNQKQNVQCELSATGNDRTTLTTEKGIYILCDKIPTVNG